MTTPTTVQVRMQLRADTAANWTSINPTLLSAEIGLERDTNKIKIGNGSTAWNSLGYFPFVVSGGVVTGNLEIGTTGTLTFEGSTADGFETTLAVVNPTADRTITLPNVTGTVITTGDTGTVTSTMIADGTIVDADVNASAAIAHSKLASMTAGFVLIGNASNVPTATALSGDVTVSSSGVTAIGSGVIVDADISATAEIAVSKLADGAARQLLQTDAAGTGVEWTNNVDVPGTLDVTGAATFDNNVTVQGDLTVNGTTTTIDTQNLLVEDKNVVIGNVTSPTDVTADGGGITLKGTTDKTITWSDTTNAWTSSEPLDLPAGAAATPSLFFGADVNTGLYSPGADQVAISTGGTGRLFIDSSGRLLVGTSTSRSGWFNSASWGNPTLQVEGTSVFSSIISVVNNSNDDTYSSLILGKSRATSVGGVTAVSSGDEIGRISFQGADGTELVAGAYISAVVDGTTGANDLPTRLVLSTTADGASSPTERLRINSSGQTLINITTGVSTEKLTVNNSGSLVALFRRAESSGSREMVRFIDGDNDDCGSIDVDATTNTTTYSTSSDYRLKQDVAPYTGGIEKLKELKPCTWNWISDPNISGQGFIAHEAQAVVPECVTGTKDEVDDEGSPIYQGIDQSKLVPLLTAALQEAIGKIETLEARLNAAGL